MIQAMATVTDAIKATFVSISEGVKNSPLEDDAKGAFTATIGQLFIMWT